jgi:hypothetical protein
MAYLINYKVNRRYPYCLHMNKADLKVLRKALQLATGHRSNRVLNGLFAEVEEYCLEDDQRKRNSRRLREQWL